MKPEEIVTRLATRLSGVIPKSSWGETALFYNPNATLPNGVYFCTIKEHDGEKDRASNLNRDGVFRLAIGLPSPTYVRLFGAKPPRPAKGGVVRSGHDFTELNRLMPHPIYAWMGWVQILSPTRATFEELQPLLEEAHRAARTKFEKKIAQINRGTLFVGRPVPR